MPFVFPSILRKTLETPQSVTGISDWCCGPQLAPIVAGCFTLRNPNRPPCAEPAASCRSRLRALEMKRCRLQSDVMCLSPETGFLCCSSIYPSYKYRRAGQRRRRNIRQRSLPICRNPHPSRCCNLRAGFPALCRSQPSPRRHNGGGEGGGGAPAFSRHHLTGYCLRKHQRGCIFIPRKSHWFEDFPTFEQFVVSAALRNPAAMSPVEKTLDS
jgi:hypothetical protein